MEESEENFVVGVVGTVALVVVVADIVENALVFAVFYHCLTGDFGAARSAVADGRLGPFPRWSYQGLPAFLLMCTVQNLDHNICRALVQLVPIISKSLCI